MNNHEKKSLTFKVGDQPLPNFQMIERHYFRNKLIKSFDFNFGFCIPGSTNTWEAVYNVPTLDRDLIDEIIANPFETQSDSFYFVDDKLVIHNKARYSYVKCANDDHDGNADIKEMKPKNVSYGGGIIKHVDRKELDDESKISQMFGETKLASDYDESFDSYAESKEEYSSKDKNIDGSWSKEACHNYKY